MPVAFTADPSLPDLTVMLCTFHREQMLIRALQSVLELARPDDVTIEILVVDNSDEGTAKEVVEGFAAKAPLPVRYLPAHPANISVARNAGVTAARGRYLAMIDDDMTVEPDWLQRLWPMLRQGRFDALFGPVEPAFEAPDLATPEARRFFSRAPDLADGAELRVMGPARTRNFTPGTGNAFFDRAACFGPGKAFNEIYGRSGGEDLDFFCRLEKSGCRLGWVAGAVAKEFVSEERCAADYLERRSFVGGQIFAAIYIRNSASPIMAAFKVTLIAIAQLGVFALKSLLSAPAGDEERRARAIRLASIRGKLAWRRMAAFYGIEPRGRSSG